MMSRHKWFFAPLILVAIAVFGFLTMFLWNYTMPGIFRLPEINFGQALCLLILSRLFFGGHFRPNHSRHGHELRQRMASLSPEEREIFMKRFSERRSNSGWWDKCRDTFHNEEAKKTVE
jgi:hypothetical protein